MYIKILIIIFIVCIILICLKNKLQNNDIFYDIEALIYNEGQFIKSKTAEIEISKKSFNLVFMNGERLLMNSSEKSKTYFDKFTFSLENKLIDELMMDKEHFNTHQLIN